MISPSQVHFLAQEQHKEFERKARHYHEIKAATSANLERLGDLRLWIGKQMVTVGERLQTPPLQACSPDCTQANTCAAC